MPVLGTDVAFAGHRIAGQCIVAVDDTVPWEHPVVEPDEADHPVRHRAHRHHRAHRQGAGAEVGPGRPSRQVAVQERADVGQAHHRLHAGACVGEHIAELALQLAGLPGIVVTDTRKLVDPVLQRSQPFTQWPCTGEGFDDVLQPVDVFGELAGELHAVAADVVERQGGVDPGVRVVGHRNSREDTVDAETPCVLDEVDAVRLAMLAVETPADVGLAHPAGDVLEVVVGEPEARPHRRRLREVEHLAGGRPTTREREQLRCHAEQRVGLHERAVREAHPKLVRGMNALDHVAEAEAGDDQRRVGLDVRAHDEDVAGLERLVVGEQAEQNLAQDVDLAGGTVAAVHLHRPVVGLERSAFSAHDIGGDVGLQPAEQRVRTVVRRRDIHRLWGSEGRPRWSSRRSRPRVASSGWPTSR